MAQLPDPKNILAFIQNWTAKGDGPPARRDIAKAFKVKGPERATLRRLLSAMEDEGVITLDGKRTHVAGALPPVTVMDVIGVDEEGDLQCAPTSGPESENPPAILLSHAAASKTKPAIGVGSRFLGHLDQTTDGSYVASPIKVIGKSAMRVLGIFTPHRRGGGFVEPVSKKGRGGFEVSKGDEGGAEPGDLVWIEVKNSRGYGPKKARVREVIGDVAETRNWSLIALANNEIPTDFPDAVMREAAEAALPTDEFHEDLTHRPFITIDPATAKDHDDAVLAEKDSEGWKVTVAIADVSWFVRPGSTLDKEAQKRGNSVYLVDRVVPMLPERLSNDLCSLKAGLARPSLCCEMRLDEEGRKKGHRFFRAMINSHASLSYEEAQAAADGHPGKKAAPFVNTVINPLWAAYRAMQKARLRRPALDLDLPEREIVLQKDGAVKGVKLKDRFDAHRLIEAMMVAANVCAAESLEKAKRALIYRVHDEPNPDRVDALREYLASIDYSLPKGQVLTPISFNRILAKAKERDELDMIAMAILRTQSQAIYATKNTGHFGLYLTRYTHFTSPIRRYADLTVHRALVAAHKMGPGGVRTDDEERLTSVADSITVSERRAISAERETQDRFMASYLQTEIGVEFKARIGGVTRAGLFVTLEETGADGFVPMR
ncbi:MAG: VacB/RNase II family 3'-5' exoribonuclease, partial [Pseudomonadota bacterium]